MRMLLVALLIGWLAAAAACTGSFLLIWNTFAHQSSVPNHGQLSQQQQLI